MLGLEGEAGSGRLNGFALAFLSWLASVPVPSVAVLVGSGLEAGGGATGVGTGAGSGVGVCARRVPAPSASTSAENSTTPKNSSPNLPCRRPSP
jgi:hypothetical protein